MVDAERVERLKRRLKTEQTTLQNIDRITEEWKQKRETQVRVIAGIEEMLADALKGGY